jgi:hypothetical protein
VTKLLEYLGMDIQTMTTNDWLGVFFTVAAAGGMAMIYFIVLRPANRDAFESQRGMALDDEDDIDMGDRK